MDLKDFPYRAVFASTITPLVSEEKDKYLALASSEEIRKLIPDLPTQDIDLLPWAAQGFNINRANKNDDGINTEIALTMYKGFINRYLDIEHKRSNIIGTILTANLAEFGTNKPLTEDDVDKFENDKPFNVVLGGVIWKIVNPKLADLIEESNDKDSDKYMAFSISWELGFKEFDIAILKDESPNLDGAEIITGEKVDKLKKYLKAFGGSGVMNGKRLIRMPTGKIVSLGAAITEKPAAFVKGIITASEKDEFSENLEHLPDSWEEYNKDFDSIDPKDHDCDIGDEVKSEADIKSKVKEIINAYKELKSGNINKSEFTEKTGIELTFAMKLAKNFFLKQKSKNKTTQMSKSSVTKREDIMKFNSIEDITDENLKQANASAITEFVKSELTKASEKWDKEKKDKANELSEAKQSIENTVKELASIKASLEALNKEREDRVQLDNFNTRMSEIDASYTLDDETRSALVDDIKAIASDEDYEKYKVKIGKILKAYKKSKSQKDSDEQQSLYREDNMNAKKKDGKDMKKEAKGDMDMGMGKKGKKSDASENSNQIGKDNSYTKPEMSDDMDKDPGTDSDNQFVNRDNKDTDPTNGENNGEHPNQIGKDNWNKSVAGKVTGKSSDNDGGQNAGASVIEDALNNAEKVGQNIPNTSSSKPQSMKEKYGQMFASSIEVNGKKLVL